MLEQHIILVCGTSNTPENLRIMLASWQSASR
jgi:hypothetical protein